MYMHISFRLYIKKHYLDPDPVKETLQYKRNTHDRRGKSIHSSRFLDYPLESEDDD